jgi:small subunit ribosomal protein S17
MMAEDEKKDTNEETPQDESPQDAGPVAEDDSSSSRDDAAGEESSSAPPASEESAPKDEAPEADAPAPAEEKAAAPAAESEPNPEDELPWKEKRRLERSRRPHEATPPQSPEERKAARMAEQKRRGAERRKERAGAKAKKTPGTGTPVAEKDANAAKVRQGVVVSDKGQKSITVRVDIVRRHPTYEKVIRRSRTLHAHDERNEAGEGDTVRVVETRPMSKTKRWRLVEILEKAK